MVRLKPDVAPQTVQPAQAVEDSFGEQFFPQQMSWYAAEGPQGLIEAGRRKVRENPWAAVGIALMAGMALAVLAPPLIRAGVYGLEMAANLAKRDGDGQANRAEDG